MSTSTPAPAPGAPPPDPSVSGGPSRDPSVRAATTPAGLSRFRGLDLLPLAAAAWLVGQILWIWWLRLPYPYDLEWMEGGMLGHAWRLQQGLDLYVEPGPDFIPYIYPPGYSSVVATLGLGGLTPAIGRMVSIVGTLTAASLLAVGVARHGGSRVLGVLSAACFIGCYSTSGAFYDLVRPDGLYMALLAGSLIAGLERGRGPVIASGLLLAAAFAVKHNAAIFGFPLVLAIFAREGWRAAALFVAASAVPAGALAVGLDLTSDRLFTTYLLEVPSSHPTVFERILPGTPAELIRALPVPLVFGSLWFITETRRRFRRLPEALVWLAPAIAAVGAAYAGLELPAPKGVEIGSRTAVALSCACIGAAIVAAVLQVSAAAWQRTAPWRWVYMIGVAGTALVSAALMRGHFGGFLNVYIPLHWIACFGLGIAVSRLRGLWPRAGIALTALAITGQLVFLHERDDRWRLVPTEADRAAGDKVVSAIAKTCEGGEVWSPYAAWLPTYAGHAPHGHLIALWDVNHKQGPLVGSLPTIREAVESKEYFSCIVEGGRSPLKHGIPEHYELGRRIDLPRSVLTPKTGWRVRPTQLLVPAAD